jgi:hypothetical protein
MANPAIDRDTVHRYSEDCALQGDLYRSTANRLMREQKRLLSFFKKNMPAMDAQTGEVSLYLFSVVVRIFDRSGGRLAKVNGQQIQAATAKIGGVMGDVLPFDEGFAERVRAVEWRAQPHILDEALWALFEREERKDEEVNVPLEHAGLIFSMLWASVEALDSAWRPPSSFSGVDYVFEGHPEDTTPAGKRAAERKAEEEGA